MRTLLAPLLGFALFGAIFAAMYYVPTEAERALEEPRYRIDPEEVRKDRLWESARGENVTVDITVLKGGPVGVHVVHMDDLIEFQAVANGTIQGAPLIDASLYRQAHNQHNITGHHNFTLFADGTRTHLLLYVSELERPSDYENLSAEEREPFVTEIAVTIRYVDSEAKSLVFGYLFAAPSMLLVGLVFWLKWKKRGRPLVPGRPLEMPRDKGL